MDWAKLLSKFCRGNGMKTPAPCHQVLVVPTEQASGDAVSFALQAYRRILANWASDLLVQRECTEHNRTFADHSQRIAA